ncbi:T9SS type A sorting domain-containing protein [Aequorivita capsosiphonis]|uniref:T9SS type A sorting domain-containing protein n=1 Tax=Aequorivita capsosiphonis TaxID=487317 RepID=UPI000405A8BD|nr:T9SS type A sorting domain-containing protein [Aequorivita capsosiphonis]
MKKTYILALALGAFSLSMNAQTELTDDFESYNLGPLAAQADHWRTWSGVDGGTDDADVSDDEAFSGDQSLLISGNVLSDEILLVPSAPLSGIYSIEYYAYIPAGASGYFNMQAALTPEGQAWNQALMGGNVFFNCGGSTPGSGSIDQSPEAEPCTIAAVNFTYPEDEWFKVDCVYNLDLQTWDMFINDVPTSIENWPFEFNTQVFIELAGLDFYSAGVTNNMYVDNVKLFSGDILAANDFSENKFSVYPNPVKDMLNIKSAASVDNVIVYDILGKVVLQENPGKISPAINMSSLPSGSYLVKVTIGNSSNTVKVLK